MLEPDDHVFIDILCFPHNENDPKFYDGIYSVFMDALSQRTVRALPTAATSAPISIDMSGIQDELRQLRVELVGELRAQRGAAAAPPTVTTQPVSAPDAAAADLQGALNAAINAYFALAEPRPDAKAFVAAQLQMRGAQRNPGARRGAFAVNVSEM